MDDFNFNRVSFNATDFDAETFNVPNLDFNGNTQFTDQLALATSSANSNPATNGQYPFPSFAPCNLLGQNGPPAFDQPGPIFYSNGLQQPASFGHYAGNGIGWQNQLQNPHPHDVWAPFPGFAQNRPELGGAGEIGSPPVPAGLPTQQDFSGLCGFSVSQGPS
jgi:hypothetical protein